MPHKIPSLIRRGTPLPSCFLQSNGIIVPGLTKEEDVKIMDLLLQAREAGLDVKDAKDIGAAFEPYKTQIEQYLISEGHDWHALDKENGPKVGQAQSQVVPPADDPGWWTLSRQSRQRAVIPASRPSGK